MAIYHVSIKSFSRGKGQSSVAAAAYRAGINLRDTTHKTTHKYGKRSGVVSQQMLAPNGAPRWCFDVRSFWDINEQQETRANARVAREVEVSLPSSLDALQRKALALDLGQLLVDRYQAAVLVAVHSPGRRGDQRNHHVHLLISARKVDASGLGERACAEFDARQGAGATEMKVLRGLIASTINAHLVMAGVDARVDHRTLRAQAQDAFKQGDFEKARALTRAPKKRISRGEFFQAKRHQKAVTLGEKVTSADRRFAQILKECQASREGRLIHDVPASHNHESALRDRARETGQGSFAPQESRRFDDQLYPNGQRPSQQVLNRIHTRYSPLTRQASKVTRLARATGKGAEVLNQEAELIEQWLEAQHETARQALDILNSLPGIQIEDCFNQAYDALMCRRVDHYATKPFLFEDTEQLGRSMLRYARMLVSPYRAQCDYLAAKARLSEFDGEAPTAESALAARQAQKAKHMVSKRVMKLRQWRIDQARNTMDKARECFEKNFKIDLPIAPIPQDHSSNKTLDSNESGQWQLRFKPPRL
ncbi:MobA/MobL family protein [Xanthomonas citri pv. malvacearum]|uniref:Plasmid mobilization protein n=2 Tax=Xanthomonas citri TaxID=346 RepID=A0AA44Z0J6_XANCM|nr:MobA/MobL family protein [Xanthomonas citri]MCC4629163.1 MobA/MobL family protein [Xanthomonas citri]NMI13266.1 plasmid mobilization protein [Xanthomonas citri]OOW93893.1 plasmid mobilization protein [Xanthomonas citri pv. malvacearum]PUE93214.1 plasmid mobilization protein [Xanthomonas citri pv. malvacearum]QGL17188.1 plasmid mobilization protein [Xanthomonas citri pv. malvacearum]